MSSAQRTHRAGAYAERGARLLNAVRLERLCQQLENSQSGDRLLEALRQDVANEVQVLETQLLTRLNKLKRA
ncbi:hypothetical protein C2E15_18260 [Mixta gaviniae]|uniref:Uncharacterized protein n=1 Tax=Mixta gaviniae TaxID=665914 RepID=A0A2L0IJR8_9GAMM|nr:hypothetical protein C2E15_18260 [Mixta gaviniae]